MISRQVKLIYIVSNLRGYFFFLTAPHKTCKSKEDNLINLNTFLTSENMLITVIETN